MKKINHFPPLLLLIAALILTTGCRQRIIESDTHTETTIQSEALDEEVAPPETVEQTIIHAQENETADTSAPSPNDLGADIPSGPSMAEQSVPDGTVGQEALANAQNDATVGVILDEYGAVLEEGLGSLYECQRGFLYLELTEDYRTIDNTAAAHALLLAAGGYNVAEKRHNTLVDDGWIIRKNPTVIIKCVAADILGSEISDTAAAQSAHEALLARPGWGGISAVIGGSVMLVSESLLDSEAGQLVLKLYLAREMYPELFGSIDVNALSHTLLGDGIYTYGG